MDIRLAVLSAAAAAVFLAVIGWFGWLTPLFRFAALFGLVNMLILFAVILGLGFAAFRFDGTLRLLALGGLAIVLFIFLIFPFFFDILTFQSLLGLGFYGILLLVLLIILAPPPDVDYFLSALLKRFFGIPMWLGEVLVLSITFILFSVVAISFPFAWQFLVAEWTISPVAILIYIALLVVAIFIGDRVIQKA